MGARPSGFAQRSATAEDGVAPKADRVWSAEQTDIFDWFANPAGDQLPDDPLSATGNPNLVVDAVAGSGKTTTIIEGVKRAPEQRPIICAFNKRIADELNDRLTDSYATAKTLHSLGYSLIRRQWRGMPVEEKDYARADSITKAVCKPHVPDAIQRLVTRLHTKAREMCPTTWGEEVLYGLALRFDFVPDEGWTNYPLEWVVATACEALAHASTVAPTKAIGIDYADMLFLPLAWDLTSKDYDLGVVDETQDMTIAQLELMQRSVDGRLAIIGDRHQAIYGFRGADTAAMDRLKRVLKADEKPLTTSYRCEQAIIRQAQKLVPHIRAREGAGGGTVDACDAGSLTRDAQARDFILSRLNAPLMTITFALLRHGKRARMVGRDIGKGIEAIVRKLKPADCTDLVRKVDEWRSTMVTRLAQYDQRDQIERVKDQAAMITALATEVDSLGDLQDKLKWLFVDAQAEDQIICSSVHKAKGLEADRVWLYAPSFYRRGRSEEEDNIAYVAITRAKEWLTYVDPHELMQP